MAFIPGSETHPLSDAVSVSNNRVFNVVQVADPNGTLVDPSAGGGDASAANQVTIIGHVDAIDGKLAALQSGAMPVGDNGSSLTVDGRCYRFAGTITRPANTTAYATGDAIGDTGGSAIITLSNIGPSGGFIQIQSIRLLIYSGTLPTPMTGLRLHLYQTSPTAIADNAAWDLVSGDRSTYLDFIDLPMPTDMGSTLFTKADYPGSLLKLADGYTSLFGILQTVSGATFAENSTVVDLRISAIEMSR